MLVYKDHLQLKHKPSYMTELMELMNFNVAVKGININLYVIYRPPNGSAIELCDSLAMILERNINIDKGKLLMLVISIYILMRRIIQIP